jgi:hypothetical protein
MQKDRVICSGEKLCGCWNQLKGRRKKGGELVLIGEPIINKSMENCARFIKGAMGDAYCCLTREVVHIIK